MLLLLVLGAAFDRTAAIERHWATVLLAPNFLLVYTLSWLTGFDFKLAFVSALAQPLTLTACQGACTYSTV